MPPTASDDLNPPEGERRTPDLDELTTRLPDVLGAAALRRELDWQEVDAVLELVEQER